jgi:hypothetical protein
MYRSDLNCVCAVEQPSNPLDVVESMASSNGWPCERSAETEIIFNIGGRWADYQSSFTWMEDIEVLHLACGFEMKIPQLRLPEAQCLIAGINEQLWLGHFDIWPANDVVILRHPLLLAGARPSARQCEIALGSAVDTCERYYRAFQFVVWAGKTAREAIDSVTFETIGQA